MINQCRDKIVFFFNFSPEFCCGVCASVRFWHVGYRPQFEPSCWLNEQLSYDITQVSRGKQPMSLHVRPYSILIKPPNGSSVFVCAEEKQKQK